MPINKQCLTLICIIYCPKKIFDLGYAATNTWTTYKLNGQTAGFLTRFKATHLAFLTIHGAGHEVPAYQPEIAYDMWSKFLAGDFTTP